MRQIIIASKNPFKQKKLSDLVSAHFEPIIITKDILAPTEKGNNFLEIAKNKAIKYSLLTKSLVICSDGGAVIPALNNWNPLKTKRFSETDEQRISELLAMMEDKEDRTIRWFEAIAVADNGKLVFSTEAEAMPGVISKKFNPSYYQPGIWLCSITEFPQFDNKNFFELTPEERNATEDSWSKLGHDFANFFK